MSADRKKVTLKRQKEPKTPLTSINRYARQLRIMTHCWQKMRQRAYKQFKKKNMEHLGWENLIK